MTKLIKKINNPQLKLAIILIVAVQVLQPVDITPTEAKTAEASQILPNFVVTTNELPLKPAKKEYSIVKTYTIPITSYTSHAAQTDSSPCITANGYNVCKANEENVIAANFLPFGTKVMIPEHFGDRVFTVQDRMNARYHYRADIWMKDYKTAIKWGVKYTKVVVVKEVNSDNAIALKK